MRRYETIIIVDPDVSEEKRNSILDNISSLISKHGGLLIETENWGVKKVAYEIKNKSRGYYIKLDFCSEVTLIQEMEYFFRINDNLLKFMTIVLEKETNIEVIKNILAEANQSKNEHEGNGKLKDREEDTKKAEHKINTVEED